MQIRTENTNDEAPRFAPSAQYLVAVAEDAQGGTPVVQVQAIDPDGDQVSYGFEDSLTGELIQRTELFEIDEDTGRGIQKIFTNLIRNNTPKSSLNFSKF